MTVYEELHTIAARAMRHERRDHTLTPTTLLNEAFVRLGDLSKRSFSSQTQFCAAFATAVRRILVDHARKRNRKKRGGKDACRQPFGTSMLLESGISVELLDLHEALEKLQHIAPQCARVVELRYFGGLSVVEVAGELEMSKTNIEKLWRRARAWLHAYLTSP